MKTANQKLIDYIMSLTDDQADKIAAHIGALKRIVNMSGTQGECMEEALKPLFGEKTA